MKKGSRKGRGKGASTGMASHELLREVFKKPGAKNVAAELNLSLSLIHQWSRPREGWSEAMNPLDRVAALMQFTGDRRLIGWLCAQADGFFVQNPPGRKAALSSWELLAELGEFEVAASACRRQPVASAELWRLRESWERLKADGEGLVRLCERR